MDDEQGTRMRRILWVLGGIAAVVLLLSGVGNGVTSVELVFYAIVIGVGAVIVLAIRALVRVGDKRPPPVQLVTPSTQGMTPGWYPDQRDPKLNRWYNGSEWTSATLPRE
ncbi:DUF2510 domain-containing protein (plasmid) [Rhodococcus sp. ZPP]|uniref:DUF2510 domain-containing protein n=1 Tax=Rhodococcus TaxID=1827 RepID=UPI0006BB5181|nr:MULTISPECIES: DUF2510 domain-containing protein [Rhodococcus]QHE73674.1 hypothetical protein GFS60_07337 [Rhodococcus sp. WAY2]QTJ71167.1 DUF2510 domain-containing protein [Rhodococcus sp. ZPP]